MSWIRALLAWLLIVVAESIHGAARQLFLAPAIGDLPARQVGVLTGSVIILAIAAFTHAVPISLCLFAVGLASGVLTLYFQLLASEISTPDTRGSTLAIAGLGWGLSHLTTPLLMGALTDAVGIHDAFHLFGALAVALALGLAPLHAWAFRGGRPR